MRLEAQFIDSLMRKNSRALYFATQNLPVHQRDGLRALFTFFQISRHSVDQAQSKLEAQSSVGKLARLFETGIASRYETNQPIVDQIIDDVPDFGLAWEAWCSLEEEFGVPRVYAIEFVRGLQLDADGYRPDTTEDLLRYVYRTGGVLGLIACHILATEASAQQPAVDAASAARLTTLAQNVYTHFTLGRIYVPTEWMSYSVTRSFAPAWANEASRLFNQHARILASSARLGFTALPWKTRLAVAGTLVYQLEKRSSLARKVDRVADELIRQGASTVWSYLRPRLQSARDRALSRTLAPAPLAPLKNPELPVRDISSAMRNQTMLISRDL